MPRKSSVGDSWARAAIYRQDELVRRFKVGDEVLPAKGIASISPGLRGVIVGIETHDALVQREVGARREAEALPVDYYVVQWGGARRGQSSVWNDLTLRPAPRRKMNPAETSRAYSAATSIRQVPALLRAVAESRYLPAGTVNVDVGGGRFDDGSNLLASVGVENLVVDPGNRSAAHNRAILDRVQDGGAHSATVANVLNVIPDRAGRRAVLELAHNVVAPGGLVLIDCYEGDAKGVGRETSKGWQENRRLSTYLVEVREVFPGADIGRIGKGRFIVARR